MSQYPPGGPPRYPTGPGVGLPRPVAVQAVAGTPFGLVIVEVPKTASGPATASLVAGVGSLLVAFVVSCFAALGASGGWGPVVAGAFSVLAVFAAVAALLLGRVGLGQIRRGNGTISGRGLALAGLSCGIAGLGLTATALAGAFLLAASVA